LSLLGVAVLALLPIAFALRSTPSAPPREPADAKGRKQAADKEKKAARPAEKTGGATKGLTRTGPAGLRIALDSPAAILSRGKELGLDDKQRQELEKL
jgi:hypothetical protein